MVGSARKLEGEAGLNALCAKYGVPTLQDEFDAISMSGLDGESLKPLSDDDFGQTVNGHQLAAKENRGQILQSWLEKPVPRSELIKLAGEPFGDLDHRDPYGEEGQPGTPIIGGLVQQEPTAKYGPYQVRGYAGFNSLYEQYYRQEPLIFEGINEGNNIFASGRIKWHCPDVPRSEQTAAEEFTEWIQNLWNSQWRGPQYLQRHLGAAKIFGFYAFEIVWKKDHRNRTGFRKFAPREPSTVDRWIVSPRGDELRGITFQVTPTSSGTAGLKRTDERRGRSRYTLTTTGPTLTYRKALVANVFARANNFEGVSYLRPVLHWVKFKQVLSQIAAVTAQKYGVPIPVVQADMVQGADAYAPNQVDMDAALAAVTSVQAADGSALVMPNGVNASMLSAQGAMPDIRALFEYADKMIERVLASQAAGLASNTVGSYAQASVQDNRFLRAQPGFASEVLQPFEWLIRDIAHFNGLKLSAYPEAHWVMDGFDDASRWIADVTTAMGGAPMWEWPDEMKAQALFKLDLDPTTFDDFEPPAMPVQSPGAAFSPTKEDRPVDLAAKKYDHIDFTPPEGARDAAQQGLDYRSEYGRGGTETGIARARDIANGRTLSPETIRRMTAFFSRHEKNRVSPADKTESDGGPTNGWIAWLLWGGDPARTWSEKVARQMESADDTTKNSAHTCGPGCTHDRPEWLRILSAMAPKDDPVIELQSTIDPKDERGMNAEAIEKQLDTFADRIGRKISPIVTEMQTLWRDRVRDGAFDAVTVEDEMRAFFRPRIENIFFDESMRVSGEAKKQLLRDYGFTVARDAEMPVRDRMGSVMRASSRSAAAEVFNRQYGYMLDSLTGNLQSDDVTGVPRLKTSTLAGVAKGLTNRAYSIGRDDLIESVQEVGDGPKIQGRRTSMLDRDVCPVCRALDFEEGGPVHVVGSSAYYTDMPPNRCEGGDQCRCAYIYTIPDSYQGTLEEIAAGEGFNLPDGAGQGFSL